MATWTKAKPQLSSPASPGPGDLGVVAAACNASDPTQQGWGYDTATGHITHGGLCLSADVWGPPVHLYSCGNSSTHQGWNYTCDGFKSNKCPAAPYGPYARYVTVAKAGGGGLYPAALEAAQQDIHPGIQKAYVYRVSATEGSYWSPITASGGALLRNPATGQCLAVRAPWKPPPALVWTAPLPAKGQSRHLYVDGVRANRTRIASWSVPSTTTDAGYTITDAAWCATALSCECVCPVKRPGALHVMIMDVRVRPRQLSLFGRPLICAIGPTLPVPNFAPSPFSLLLHPPQKGPTRRPWSSSSTRRHGLSPGLPSPTSPPMTTTRDA